METVLSNLDLTKKTANQLRFAINNLLFIKLLAGTYSSVATRYIIYFPLNSKSLRNP